MSFFCSKLMIEVQIIANLFCNAFILITDRKYSIFQL